MKYLAQREAVLNHLVSRHASAAAEALGVLKQLMVRETALGVP
jgi:hypothetical protein